MFNDLLAFPLWALLLMATGAAAIAWLVVWPLLWVVLYGIGSTIFQLLTVDWRKARAKPLLLAKYVLWKWPLEGMKDAMTWPASTVTAGPWEWRPLFRYSKRES